MIIFGKTWGIIRYSQSIKAVLLLSLTMVLALSLGTLVLLLDLRRNEVEQAKDGISNLSRILAEQTTRTIDGVTLSMRDAKERLSDNIGQNLPLTSTPVRLLLRSRIAGLPQVKSMFVVDSSGTVANSSRSDLKSPLSAANRDFFLHFVDSGIDDLFISRPEQARIDGQWTFYLSMRLTDAEGAFRGVLVAAINLEHFQSLYESITLDFVSRISLLNRDGVFMAGRRQDLDSLGKTVIDPASLEESGMPPDDEVVVTSEDGKGNLWFASYRAISKYPLIVSPAVREEDALIPWKNIALPVAGCAFAVAAFIVAATFTVVLNLLRKEGLEKALVESDGQLRHMVQSARDAILTIDASGNIVLFNSAAERLFRAKPQDALGQRIDDFLHHSQHPKLASNLMRHINEVWQSPPGTALLGIIALADDNTEFPVELSLSTTTFRGEVLITAIFRDLSERQRSEHQLVEKNLQLQELSARLENVREEERSRISRELHDELGQSLTGIRMEISWLGGRLQALQPEMDAKVSTIKKQIDSTIAAVRRISSDLRPLVLDDLGFSAAANWYIAQFAERSGITVNADLPDTDPAHGGALATTLFRILQESLTNIARHAEAMHVGVTLRREDRQWRLSITDDGKGFDDMSIRSQRGIGLLGMRERVQMQGGTFVLKSAPNQGTLVEVCIPTERT